MPQSDRTHMFADREMEVERDVTYVIAVTWPLVHARYFGRFSLWFLTAVPAKCAAAIVLRYLN
jgi:hypothetical protein